MRSISLTRGRTIRSNTGGSGTTRSRRATRCSSTIPRRRRRGCSGTRGSGKKQLPGFLRAAALEELQFLRRYCAKLIYEAQLYATDANWDTLGDLYVETLSAATSFRYKRADAFIDVDSRFYAARYLRAWQLGALLATVLTERFDDDWFRNPRAGPWLIGQLLNEGQRELADEVATRVSGQALSFAPVVDAVTRLVG